MTRQVETVSELSPALAREWDELASRLGASPFARAGWIGAWSRAFGTGDLNVLLLRRQGRIAGLLPLMRRRGGLVSPTNWHTPAFTPLAEDDSVLAELIGAALQATRLRLDLSFVPEDSPTIDACSELAREQGFHVLLRPVLRSPYLELDGDWEKYEGRLPSKKRSGDRRRRRRLEEQGEVSFQAVDGSTNLTELLREGFGVEAAGGAGKTPILASPETARFYAEVAEWAAERGWLRLWFLRVDGHAAAFAFALVHDGVHFDLKIGFDPGYRRFSPGILLMQAQIKHAFEAPLRRYEFVGGAEQHKLAWTDTAHLLNRVQVFPRTPAGLANRMVWEHGRPLAKRLLRR